MGDNRICRRYGRRPAQRAVLVIAVLVAGAPTALAQARAPVPAAAARARAQELFREVYGKEYDAAKTSEQKTELAEKLLDQAAESKGDPASHFVLLRVAKEVAVLGADGETALEAVERMVAAYDVDAMETRLDCLKELADAAKLSSQRAAFARQAYSLVDVALAEDDFEAAGRFGRIAEDLAKRGRNYSLVKEVVARMEELEELRQAYAEYQKAQVRLEDSPTDPEANLAAGRYLCLSRGDWDRGIPMLALGSDPALKVPAVKELVGADSPDAQIALGDAWWDAAQTKEGRERKSYLLRAGHWYEKAQPKVTSGLGKVKLDRRLAEIAKIQPHATEVASERPRSGTPARSAKRGRTFDPANATLLGTLRGHTGAVYALAFGADESILASGDDDGTVIFWDVRSGQKRGDLRDREGRVLSVAFSRDGSLFASGGDDGAIKLGARTPRTTLAGHTDDVRGVAFSPDGSILASVSEDRTLKLWDLARREVLHTFPCTRNDWSPAFSPDGSLVGATNDEGDAVLWDVATGERRKTFPGHAQGHVMGLAFTPDGSTLATCSNTATIRLWDVATGSARHTLEGHTGQVRSIAFAGDGATLASGGWHDGTVNLWDVASGQLRATLTGHARGVYRVAFSPDGSLLATAGQDRVVRLWGASTDSGPKRPARETRAASPVLWKTPPMRWGRLRAVGRFDPATAQPAGVLNQGRVSALAFSPDGVILFTGSDSEPSVRLWETASGRPRGSIGPPPESMVPGRKYGVQSIAISADGSMLAWGGGEPWTVGLWNPATGEVRQTLDQHGGQIWRVAITSDGSTAASGSNDKSIKLWNTSTGELLRTLESGTHSVACVAFAPDGATLASSSGLGDATVRLWDASTGELRRTLAGHRAAARCLAFSPDGSLLASGGDGAKVILHKMPPAELLRALEGHTGRMTCLAFSPEGSVLASGSNDRTVRLWDVATGRLRRTLEGFQNAPSFLAFSPDGSTLAVADAGSVKFWSGREHRRSRASQQPNRSTVR